MRAGELALTESELRELYHGQGLSQREIADRAGVTPSWVSELMERHGVTPREADHPARDPDWLRARAGEGLSTTEIAELAGVSPDTVRYQKRRIGLPVSKEGPRKDDRLGERWWLHSRLASGATMVDVADECGVSDTCVRYWRDKHGIPPEPDPKFAAGLPGDEPVLLKGTSPSRVHTDPGCHVLAGGETREVRAGDARPAIRICKFCLGEAPRPRVSAQELAAADPEDFGLSPVGDREGAD